MARGTRQPLGFKAAFKGLLELTLSLSTTNDLLQFTARPMVLWTQKGGQLTARRDLIRE